MSFLSHLAAFIAFLSYVVRADDPHIIIIGAGAAGIACATRLHQNGFKNLTILEAEERIGGRIYSLKFDKAYIDLGAQWCHGKKNNVVYNLVKDLDVLKADETEDLIYHSSQKLLDKDFSNKLYEIFESAEVDESGEEQGSMGKYLIERYNKKIRETWKNDSEKLALAKECLGLFEKRVELYDGAFSWFNIADGINYEESEDDLGLGWNGLGYKTILDVLMQKFPTSKVPIPIDDKILLKKEVENVVWGSPKNVEVKCGDGTSYTADHVVWTPSLGVLKRGQNTHFTPQLPVNKTTAIKTLGFDAVSKIIFHFPHRWWNDDLKALELAWAPNDAKKSGEAFSEGPKKEGKSWITAMVSILSMPKNPNLLLVWFAGELVPEVEKTSDETITNGLMYTLKRFLGDDYKNISRPDKVIRKNWYNDSHFYGTYSYESVESGKIGKSQMEVLSEPLLTSAGKPTVLFAGEATHPIHYATVHGAVESGFREADRLIRFYQKS